jgi:hypothetical protein
VEWTAAHLAADVFGKGVQLGAPTRLLKLLDEDQKKLLLPVEDSILDHSSLMGYSIADEMGRTIGSIVFTSVELETAHYWTWWAIGEQGTIRGIEISESRLDPEMGGAFGDHIGATTESLDGCATATGCAAAEILIMAQGL